jgi:hypothetical protein
MFLQQIGRLVEALQTSVEAMLEPTRMGPDRIEL